MAARLWQYLFAGLVGASLVGIGIFGISAPARAGSLPVDNFESSPVTLTYSGQGGWTQTTANSFATTLTSIDGWNVVVQGQAGASAGTWNWNYPLTLQAQPDVSGTSMTSGNAEVSWIPTPVSPTQPTWQTNWGLYADTSVLLVNQSSGETLTLLSAGTSSLPVTLGLTGESFVGAVGSGQTTTAGGEDCENLTWLVSAIGTADLGPLDLPATVVSWILSNLTSSGLEVCLDGTIHGAPVEATVQDSTGFGAAAGQNIQLPFPGGAWADVPYLWSRGPLTLDLGSLQYAPTFDLSMDVQLALANQSVRVAQIPLPGAHTMAGGTWSPSSAALNLDFPTEAVVGVQGPGITATVTPTASGVGPTFTAEVANGQTADFSFTGASSSGPSGLAYQWSITSDSPTANIGTGIYQNTQSVTADLSPGQYAVSLEVDGGSGNQSVANLSVDVETAPSTPGSIAIQATGLPSGGQPVFTVRASGYEQTLQGTGTLSSVPPGTYTVTAAPVTASDGTIFQPLPSSQSVTVSAGQTSTVSYTYGAGTGSLQVAITGLPQGTQAQVSVSGPNGYSTEISGSTDLLGLWPGQYTVVANEVSGSSEQEFDPTLGGMNFSTMTLGLSSQQGVFTLAAGQSASVQVEYVTLVQNQGSLSVQTSGLPSGVTPQIVVSGVGSGFSQTVTTANQVVDGLDPGSYSIQASTVTSGGNTYAPNPASQTVTVLAGSTAAASITYVATTGNLQVTVQGLPTGVSASVLVEGSTKEPTLTGSDTLKGLVPGAYTVTANPVTTVAGVPYLATVSSTGPVTVQAGQTAQRTVTYAVHTLVLVASPRSIAVGGGASSTITATVWGANGPQAGANVTLTTSMGALTVGAVTTTAGAANVGTTDGQGQVQAQLASGSTSGTATVTAQVTVDGQNATATITVEFTNGAQSASQLTLTADPTSVAVGGASVVSAKVTDAMGDPLEGVSVTLTSDQGTLASGGNIIAQGSPLSLMTGSNGEVTAILSSTVVGEASVSATVSTGSGTNPLQSTVNVQFTAAQTAAASAVHVAASPTTVPADGQSSSALTITVDDGSGDPVNGATVQVTTDLGELQVGYEFGTTVTVSTSRSGQASVLLSSDSTGTATVTAQVIESSGSGPQSSTTVTFQAPTAEPAPGSITLAVSPSSVPADGQSAATVTVTVKTSAGAAVPDVPVQLLATVGELQSGSALGPTVTVTTGSNGEASAQWTSVDTGMGTVTGTVLLSSGASGPSGTATVSFVSPGTVSAVHTLSLSASPTAAPADGQTAMTVSATAEDSSGNPVPGVTVTFSSTIGAFSLESISGGSAVTAVTTNASGQAQVQLTSSNSGTGVVEATVGSVESKPVDVTFTATVPSGSGIELSANPQDVVANGTSSATITSTLTDLLGNPLSGVSVSFTSSAGTLSATTAVTDSEGQAEVQLKDTQVGTVTVTATAGSAQGTTVVTFTNSSGSNACLLAAPSTLAATASSKLTVQLTTPTGAPAPGVEVSLSSSLGTVTPSLVTTGADGTATAELTQDEPGTADVTAQVTGYSSQSATVPSQMECNTEVTFTNGPGSLSLAATPGSVAANGTSAVTLMATVLDTSGNPAAGVQVTFSDDNALGTLSAQTATTNGAGQASVTLTSTTAGTAILSAQVTNAPNLAQTVEAEFTVTTGSSTVPTACTNADGFPVVTGITPASGPLDGGNTVTIEGCNFDGVTEVDFGDVGAVLSFTVNAQGTAISVQAPDSLSGFGQTVDVTVVTPTGTSATSTADQYAYSSSGGSCGSIPGSTDCITAGTPPSEGAPTIQSLSPSSGNEFGYTKVIITGTNFLAATQVSFGSEVEVVNGGNVSVPNSAAFTILSSTEISTIAPPSPTGNPGAVQVQVTTPEGTSNGRSYTYTAPSGPEVTAVIPERGMAAGGQKVIIRGEGFTGATAVDFSTVEIGNGEVSQEPANPASFQVVNDTEIIATSPFAPGGALLPAPGSETVDVTVTGFSVSGSVTSPITAADQFTYEVCSPYAPSFGTPVVNYVSPDVGPSSGGTEVTIDGESFSPGAEVYFGNQKASGVHVVSGTQLTAIAPSGSGSPDVQVYTANGGWSPTCAVDVYQYQQVASGGASTGGSGASQIPQAPIITSVSPDAGDGYAGVQVTIHGANLAGAKEVLFGGTPADNFFVVSSSEILVQAPPPPTPFGGPFLVQVVTLAGSSTQQQPGDAVFTYLPEVGAVQSQKTLSVPVDTGWTDTGIHVSAGEVVAIAGSGSAFEKAVVPANGLYYGAIITSNTYNPAGQGLPCNSPLMSIEFRSGEPAPQQACFSLLARIGDATPLEVGEGNVFVATSSGELYLGPNNLQSEAGTIIRNSGSWTASVEVESDGFPGIVDGVCPAPPTAQELSSTASIQSSGYPGQPTVGDGLMVNVNAAQANGQPAAGTTVDWSTSEGEEYVLQVPQGYIWMSGPNAVQLLANAHLWPGAVESSDSSNPLGVGPYGGQAFSALDVYVPFTSGPTALLSSCSSTTDASGNAQVLLTAYAEGSVDLTPVVPGTLLEASIDPSDFSSLDVGPIAFRAPTTPVVQGAAVSAAGPVVGEGVQLTGVNGTLGDYQVMTGETGTYAFVSVAPGTYDLSFGGEGSLANAAFGSFSMQASGFWLSPFSTSAPSVLVVTNTGLVLPTVTLPPGQTISGTVVTQGGPGLTSGSFSVSACPITGDLRYTDVNSCNEGLSVFHATDGTFSIDGLAPGPYIVSASESSANSGVIRYPQVFFMTATSSSGPTYTMSSGEASAVSAPTSGLVVTMPEGYYISGRVVNDAGQAVQRIVSALTSSCVASQSASCFGAGALQPSGSYSIGPLLPGPYVLEACPSSSSDGPDCVFYTSSSPGFTPAQTSDMGILSPSVITLGQGDQTGPTVVAPGLWTISGQVLSPSGAGVAGVNVQACLDPGTFGLQDSGAAVLSTCGMVGGTTTSGRDGAFSLTVLSGGKYVLEIDTSQSNFSGPPYLASGWYGSSGWSGVGPLSVTPFAVSTANVSGLKVQPAAAYAVSGTIAGLPGAILSSGTSQYSVTVEACVHGASTTSVPQSCTSGTNVGENGQYTLVVPNGTYDVFVDVQNSSGAPGMYNLCTDGTSNSCAEPSVTVNGSDLSNIDFTVVQPSVILSAPSAVTSTYTVSIPVPFGLASGDTVDVKVPTGTVLPTVSSDYSLNGQVITAVQVSGETATVTVPSSVSEAPGGVVTLSITDVTNPSAGQYTVDVWTSRATTVVASAPYSISGVTLTLGATPTPATVGQDVLLTAVVSRPVSDGTITFAVPSGTSLSCVPHGGGCSVLWNTSSLATSSFTAGSWAVKATWSGDTTSPSPVSATMDVVVNSGMFISANPFPAVVGQSVTLTAKGILPSLSGGSVTFRAASPGGSVVTLGTCSVTSDSCTLQWTPATEGDVTVFAKCTGGGCGAGLTASIDVQVESSSSSDVCTTAVVAIGSLTLTSGSSGSLPISLSQIPTGCPSLASWHLTVTFDPSVLSVQGAVGGPEWPSVTVTAVQPGTIELTAPQSDGGATGSLLATLQVTATGAAGTTSPLSLGAISLTDTNASAIGATGTAGSVNVVGSASVDLSVVPEVRANPSPSTDLSISVSQAVYGSAGQTVSGEDVSGYQLSIAASDPMAIRLGPASCPAPFTDCSVNVDQQDGSESVAAAVYQGVALPAALATVPVRLTGPVSEAVQVTTTLQAVVNQEGTALGTPTPVTVTLQRGAVYQACSADGTPVTGARSLTVADAVAALQYLVNLRQAGTGCGQVDPVALASLAPVGSGLGSQPSVADVVALLQYLVGLRNAEMNLTSTP